jgi:hypothetical protein
VLGLTMCEPIPSLPYHVFMACWLIKQVCIFMAWYLVVHRDNLTLTLPLLTTHGIKCLLYGSRSNHLK